MVRPSRLVRAAAVTVAALGFTVGLIGVPSASWAEANGPVIPPPASTPAPEAAPAATPAPEGGTATPAATGGQTSGPITPLAADSPLRADAEDFWHYAKLGKYDIAKTLADKILASGAPNSDIAQALQAAASAQPTRNLYGDLLMWQQLEPMKDTAGKLLKVLKGFNEQQATNEDFIKKQIERLSSTERGYQLGLQELKNSGELAVPYMISYLGNPSARQYHAAIRRALPDLGRKALNPLLAACEIKNQDVLVTVINVLAQMGYDAAVPQLARLATSPDQNASVHDAAKRALMRFGIEVKQANPAQLFYDLAEKFYYNNAVVAADRATQTTYIWTWDEANHWLRHTEVPPSIFNDNQAMRAAEYAIKLDNNMPQAVSLWLAADYKREADLPEGQKDPSQSPNAQSAHFYGVAAGTQYLESVLDRALHDRTSSVALRSLKSLAEIAGQSNLFDEPHQPMLDALRFPDHLVRFEAAMALANALPQKSFNGQERVVPILADALGQTGKPAALIVAAQQDQLNQLTDSLKNAGYLTAGGLTPEAAVAALGGMPTVDAVVISERLTPDQISHLLLILNQNPRTERIPRIFVVASTLSPWATEAIDKPLINIAKSEDAASLPAAIAAARTRAGSLPLDEKQATEYALRSANLLEKLAISRGQVFDLSVIEPNLLAALEDPRPEVAKAVAKVVCMLNSRTAQQALVNKAMDDKTPDELKIAFDKAAAMSIKLWGNQLEQPEIDALSKALETGSAEVRNAAAEVVGALNLPSQRATVMIVHQSLVPSVNPEAKPGYTGAAAADTTAAPPPPPAPPAAPPAAPAAPATPPAPAGQ